MFAHFCIMLSCTAVRIQPYRLLYKHVQELLWMKSVCLVWFAPAYFDHCKQILHF